MKKAVTISLLMVGLVLTSCKKDAGPAGPTGPQGPAGTNGSSNVQSSTVTTNNLSWSFDNTDNSFNATINVPAISSSVLNNGTIQVFIGDGTSTQWGALPFSYGLVQYNYTYKAGQVIISVTLSNGSAPNNPGGQQFKIVVIPPAMVKPNVNIRDYSEVKAAYNLE